MALTEKKIESLLLTKRRSILQMHKEDVLRLRAEGVTLSAIQNWLNEEYLIKTSTENIRQFCLRYSQDYVDKSQKNEAKTDDKKLFENLGEKEL